MYNTHLTKRPRSSNPNEKGLFSGTPIPAGSPILEFRGELYTQSDLTYPRSEVMQIGPDLFLGPSGGLDDHVSHSCNPNAAVKIVGRRAILYALYLIPANTEITFDYSTTASDDISSSCQCGEFQCRGKIVGFHALDEATKQSYLRKNIVPMYLINSMFREHQ